MDDFGESVGRVQSIRLDLKTLEDKGCHHKKTMAKLGTLSQPPRPCPRKVGTS